MPDGSPPAVVAPAVDTALPELLAPKPADPRPKPAPLPPKLPAPPDVPAPKLPEPPVDELPLKLFSDKIVLAP